MLKSFIKRPQNIWWRRAVFQIHLWAGAIFGLYFVVISIGGSALVFERELMNDAPALRPAPAGTKRWSYNSLIEAGHKTDERYELQSIDMRSRERRLVSATFKNGDERRVLYFDRYTGQTVGNVSLERNHGILVFLEQLHNQLLGGRTGAIVNGVGVLLLALMCGTGIILWWPGKRVWKRALTVKWQASWRRISFDLHSAVGFWTLIVVTMCAITGAYFIFPSVIQKPLRLFTQPATAKQSGWKPGHQLLSVDMYVEEATKVFPHEQLAYLYLDVFRPDGQVAVFLSRDPAKPLTLEEDIVPLDPATAKLLWTESSSQWSTTEKILMAFYSVHFGDFAGTFSKVLWVILSLSLAFLTTTGYLIWWNRLLRKSGSCMSAIGALMSDQSSYSLGNLVEIKARLPGVRTGAMDSPIGRTHDWSLSTDRQIARVRFS
jgi:uncharacterized iron-regulated membrane protein